MKNVLTRTTAIAGAVAGLACAALTSSANAEQVYGITGSTAGGSLVFFDSATPGSVTNVGSITGITAGLSLRAIDFRPATGALYGMATGAAGAYEFYTIDLATGAATSAGGGTAPGVAWPARVSMDFNPVVDRIRVVTAGSTANNFRFNPNTGALVLQDGDAAYDAGDVNSAGNPPFLAGAAYTNNVAGATSTTLYVYDYNLDVLATMGSVGGGPVSPNTGTMFTVGPAVSGGFLTTTAGIGFDISGATGTAFLSYDSTAGIETFSTVNLASGAVTSVGTFGGGFDILDISVVIPAPGSLALVGLAGLTMARRRRA
jgi:hypothetical protein